MGNTQPRLKLHYVKEQDGIVSGLVQILDLEKGTAVNEVDVYVVGREKISWVSAQNFLTLKESHTFLKVKETIKVTDMEPTFSIKLPEGYVPSGHGGNYGKGMGYAVGYHVYVETPANNEISDEVDVTVHLGATKPSSGTSTGSIKFAGGKLEYEIPEGMPRGTKQTLKFKMTDSAGQKVRLRIREEGKQKKGQEQTKSEIKYEIDEVGIGSDWTPVEVVISKFANTARDGEVLKISHNVEITAIGSTDASFVNIPINLN